jgi:nitrogen fixation-related uncharacterized protein
MIVAILIIVILILALVIAGYVLLWHITNDEDE